MGEPIQSRFGNIAPFHHTHPDVPRVFRQPDAPTEGMVRGDIWVKTGGSAPVEPPVEPEPPPADTYGDAVMIDAPYGYWRLNETSGTVVADAMNQLNGTLVGASVVRGETGVSGTSYRFTDINGYVRIGSVGSLIGTNQGAFSAECWFKIGPITAATTGQVAYQLFGVDCVVNATSRTGWGICMVRIASDVGIGGSLGEVYGAVTHISTRLYVNYNTRVDDNAWHHAVMTFDGVTVRFYVDGVLRETQGGLGGNNQGEDPAAIGLNYPLPSMYVDWESNPAIVFPGNIDEVAFYRTVLAPERVLAHYQAR